VTARRDRGEVPDALPLWWRCRLAPPELSARPLTPAPPSPSWSPPSSSQAPIS